MANEKYITDEDLCVINRALDTGCDVRIQRTKNGVRIVSDQVKVLKKKGGITDGKDA